MRGGLRGNPPFLKGFSRRIHTFAHHREAAFKSRMITDAVIREEPVSGLGVRPVLAGRRNTLPYRITHLFENLPKPAIQPLARKLPLRDLPVHPAGRRLAGFGIGGALLRVRFVQRCPGCDPDTETESQPIHATHARICAGGWARCKPCRRRD